MILITIMIPRRYQRYGLVLGVISILLLLSYTAEVNKLIHLPNRVNYNQLRPIYVPSGIRHDWTSNDTNYLGVYIFSAFGLNGSSTPGHMSEIRLTGWRLSMLRQSKFKCCIRHKHGVIAPNEHTNATSRKRNLKLFATLFSCPVKAPIQDIAGVTVQIRNKNCPTDTQLYIKPFIPEKVEVKTQESFALCLKIVYGQVSKVKLKYWLDYYRSIGVDKVFLYTYKITQEIDDILTSYMTDGYVEKRRFAFPSHGIKRDVGQKTPKAWEDESIIVLDCVNRLYDYTYMAVIDLDEYLVLRKHDNVKTFMKYLMQEYPDAGGFTLPPYLFLAENAPALNRTLPGIPDFIQNTIRTPALYGKQSRCKNIVLPSRIIPGEMHTHSVIPLMQYKNITIDEDVAVINHYRQSCYENRNASCAKELLVKDSFFLDRILDSRGKANIQVHTPSERKQTRQVSVSGREVAASSSSPNVKKTAVNTEEPAPSKLRKSFINGTNRYTQRKP